MSASSSIRIESRPSKPASWWEIVIVIVLYLGISILIPGLKQFLALPLIIYMSIESWLRHRTWADNGFNIHSILGGFCKTFGWFLLVTFGTQALFIFGEYLLLPEVFAHLAGRVPWDMNSLTASLLINIAIATFLEELIFRALFQNRLSAFVSPVAAIGLVSLAFAIGHFSPGPVLVVFVDLLSVFVDSLIFGIIFQRSRNVFVSWIPHFLADIFAIILLSVIK